MAAPLTLGPASSPCPVPDEEGGPWDDPPPTIAANTAHHRSTAHRVDGGITSCPTPRLCYSAICPTAAVQTIELWRKKMVSPNGWPLA